MTVAEIAGSDADYSANALFYLLPVQRGITGAFLLGSDAARSTQNVAAPGLPAATVIGNPVFNSGYASLTSKSAYVQTPLHETAGISVMMVVRSLDTFADNAHTPVYLSNYGVDTIEGEATAHGLRITASASFPADVPPALSLKGNFGMNNAGEITQVGPSLAKDRQDTWRCIALTVTPEGVGTVKNLTSGASIVTTGTGAREPNVTTPLMIGSDGSGSLTGSCDVAAALFANVAWTDSELSQQYAWLKALVAKRNAAIVV